jgi:hypothetical protein
MKRLNHFQPDCFDTGRSNQRRTNDTENTPKLKKVLLLCRFSINGDFRYLRH